MACVAKRIKQDRAWLHDIVKQVHTGDVILFSSLHSTSNLTKYCTGSEWDHVGLVLRPSRLRDVYLLEWGGGLFVSKFMDRMLEYHVYDGRKISIRQLRLSDMDKGNRALIEEKIESFADTLLREGLGNNEVIPMGQVLKAWRKQGVRGPEFAPVVDDLSQLFCSKLCAAAWKSAGLLAPNRPAADFLPKHFGEGFDAFLDLQFGARLSAETAISFEPQRLRGMVVSLLKLGEQARDLHT